MTIAAAAAFVLGTVGTGGAAEPDAEVWMVSTRGAPRSRVSAEAGERIRYFVLGQSRRWRPSSAGALIEALHTPVPTTVFVHGNRADSGDATSEAFELLRAIRRQTPDGAFRMVIWSWPSDRIRGGNRKDVCVKAAYSDVQGHYLADFLGRLDPEVPVNLVGYSFGARVITVALDLLDGGRRGDGSGAESAPQDPASADPPPLSAEASSPSKPLPQGEPPPAEPPQRRAVLIAAALDAGWLAPGGRHGRAVRQVERMLITRNRCDPVLRLYPLMYGLGGPQALGYVGPVCLGESRAKTETADVSCSVGRSHHWSRYLAAPGLKRRLAEFSFVDSPAGEPDPALREAPVASEP
jgi:hypothetical protein